MDDLTVARAVHIMAVIHWIGGVAFVTAVILPAVAAVEEPSRCLALFEAIEHRFSAQVKISVPVAGLSGACMASRLDAWGRFLEPVCSAPTGCWAETAKEHDMSTVVRLPSRLAAATMLVIVASACTSTPPASPELMAHCQKLQMLWVRYEPILTLFHTGQNARVELAMADCRAGRYEAGIQELEKILRSGKIPVPPAPPQMPPKTP